MRVAKTVDNLNKCRCMDCPSYTMGCKVKNYPINLAKLASGLDSVDHYEKMFCAFGKSNCIREDKGCLCEKCEVFTENKLTRDEYCMTDGGHKETSCGLNFSARKYS